MSKATYIYGEREYVLTGREATKHKLSGREESKVEIRPVDITDVTDKTHNKWVKKSELFSVIDIESDA